MKMRDLALAGVAACAIAVGATAANAGTIQLGFILDRSGSIGQSNWNTIVNGLSQAVGTLIPVGGADTYEISVVTFSGSATANIQNHVVSSLLDRSNLATQIAALTTAYTGGTTNYTAAFTSMDNTLRNTSAGADKSYVNFATDGDPNPNSADGISVRNSMVNTAPNGYVDNISIEAIGSGITPGGVSLLQNQICFPTPCTVLPVHNFDAQGFYTQVADADAYVAAIQNKIRIVTHQVPEPATLALFGAGLAGLGLVARRRRKAA